MLPVVARELRVIARRRGTYWARVGASLLAMLTMLWLLIVAAAGSAVAAQGKLLFEVLSSFAFAFALLVGVRVTSDSLSSEKREGTLGLLFLTDLKGYDVVLGKLASSSLASFYSLLAVVPVLALALLIGGVSLPQVFRVALVLLNTMFFSLSVGLFVSTLSQNERKAMFTAFVLIAFFTLFPMVVLFFCNEMLDLHPSDQIEALVLLPSPLLAFMLTFTSGPWSKPPLPYLLPVGIVHLLSWVLLGTASLLLTRVSHDRPKSIRRENWSRILRNWSYGAGEIRLLFRRAMLDRNAFSWLASRERLKPHFVWFFFGVLAVLWGWGAWKYPIFFADWEIAPALLFLVHGFVKLWFASEVCSRLAEDRRVGALELLLSSPLKVSEIAEGQGLALRRQFFWPVVALLVIDCTFMLAGGGAGVSDRMQGILAMFPAGMLVLILDLAAVTWVGMWLAISQNNLNRALLGTIWRVLLLPWLIWSVLFSSIAFFQFVFGMSISISPLRMVGVWTLISVVIDVTLWLTARKRFLRDFRRLATPSFDSTAARPAVSWGEMLKRFVRSQSAVATEPRMLKVWLRRHRIAVSVIALLVLSIGLLIAYRLRLKAEVKRELQAIRQRGEPVLRSDIDQWYPAVLESENAAMQLKPALGTLSMPGGIGATNRALMQTTVDRNAKSLRIAHRAARLRKSRTDSDWADFQLGPQWQSWRVYQLSQLLGFEATVHIENADSTAALESVETVFGLAHMLGQEPLLDAQVRRLYVLNQALHDLERVLSRTSLTDAQLQQIQKTVAQVEQESLDPNCWARALIGERFRLIQFHEAVALGTTMVGAGQLPSAELTRLQWLFGLQKLTGFWDRNFLRSLRALEASIEAAKLPLSEWLVGTGNLEARIGGQIAGRPGGMFQNFVPLLGTWTVREDADMIARLRAAQTAIAMERFRLQHGHTPEELHLLVPFFMENVPSDPLDAQTLTYVRNGQGYSISTTRNPPPKAPRTIKGPNRISSQFTVNK